MSSLFSRRSVLALILASSAGSASHAADYPSRPVHIVVPYAAGGLNDVFARVLAQRLSARLGAAVVVENRLGGGGIVGINSVARSSPDGYTLVIAAQGLAAVNPSLYKDLPYNIGRDFQPISLVATFPMVLVSSPTTGPTSLSEFIALAKGKPDTLSYGSAGIASTAHLITELFKIQTKTSTQHVPFKGESQMFADLVPGRLGPSFATLGGALPLIQSGKLRPLAVATKERSPLLPDVPTVSEAGIPGFDAPGWWAILAPKGLPVDVAARLSKEFIAIGKEAEIREQMAARAVDVQGSTPEQLQIWLQSETARWKGVVEAAGIKPE